MNEWLGFLLSWILGIVCYGMYQTICEIRETQKTYDESLQLQKEMTELLERETPGVGVKMKHKSNFHKYNEEIYYQILNIVPSTEITLPQLEKELLKWNENNNDWKLVTKEEFFEEVTKVLKDLVSHGVIRVLHNREVIQINPPQAEYLSLHAGDRLSCDIPLGTDLFEYLRDCGVVCNTCKEE